MTTNGLESLMVREDRDFVGGICAAMQTLESVLAEIAVTNIPVLLVGESGTGKAMFAHRLHSLSARSEERLVSITCAAMNPALLSAELELNTNGVSGIPSQESSIGSVFFEEISELDAACQRSLLYALPGDGPARRGSLTARVISTTSRNLDEEMRAGRFRSELYYRINGVCLRLPPLRDRREDIPILVEFFLTKHSAQFGDEHLALTELTRTPVERVVEVSEPPAYSLKQAARAASREAERDLILKALEHTRWNRKRAAQELQISYKSLLYKLKQIGVQDSETGQRG
ncbi:MAG: sigma 54-interacting transcriptional regulator [Candidatus Acidiferrales bacterium]